MINVHLLWAEPSAEALPELLPLLSAEELAAAKRFRFERHRVLYAFAHGVLRKTLAEHAGGDPRSLKFETVANGRPELKDRAVRFNLSHTAGLVLIGITERHDLGVDTERIDRSHEEPLAARVFTPPEFAAWRDDAGFFERWTLKESYIKARGAGLSLDLRRFGFPRLGERPRIESDFGDADEWQFLSFAPTPHHLAAAAIRAHDDVNWNLSPIR